MDCDISKQEIIQALVKSKKGRATGFDELPVEVLFNNSCISFMYKLFNRCFNCGIYPSMWKMGVINPIPKGSTSNVRNPMLYRGITLAVSSYKLFCSIMNARLQLYADENGLIADEQNGFRRGRSCTDHLMSLVNIVSSRIDKKQNTFAAFIDFKQAYDSISRNLLWKKLQNVGINGNSKFFQALRGIYDNVRCSVKVNGKLSEWFPVTNGLKQGCLLSPLLFNLYINDLVLKIKSSCNGITIGDENVCLLMYADDLVLLARNERDLQSMLDVLNNWCDEWKICINPDKSQIVHFRQKSISRSSYLFKVGSNVIKSVSQYKYLGLLLNEHLDFKVTADHVAKSAMRALGLIIAKSKVCGGLPFNCFKQLYESIVLPTIHYGSAIWGHKQFSSINSVHYKACKYFLGVRKFTSNAAVIGDMGLVPPVVNQYESITRQWCRMVNMADTRLNKKIFMWSYRYAALKCKNWVYKTMNYYNSNRCAILCNVKINIDKEHAVKIVKDATYQNFINEWEKEVRRDKGKRTGNNKLRTYKLFKMEFGTESYVYNVLCKKYRSCLAKFRCGNAPIRLETGRYEGLPLDERICPVCSEGVEDETHVFTKCSLYIDIREELYERMSYFYPDFIALCDKQKTQVILSSECDEYFIAKTCSRILERRQYFV